MCRKLSSSWSVGVFEVEIRPKRRRFFIFSPMNAIYHISLDSRGLGGSGDGGGLRQVPSVAWCTSRRDELCVLTASRQKDIR
jgi:hypothetical protein